MHSVTYIIAAKEQDISLCPPGSDALVSAYA